MPKLRDTPKTRKEFLIGYAEGVAAMAERANESQGAEKESK